MILALIYFIYFILFLPNYDDSNHLGAEKERQYNCLVLSRLNNLFTDVSLRYLGIYRKVKFNFYIKN